MKQCKCEHWQECPVCQPRRFDAEGNRLPPEPPPLQAARARVEQLEAVLDDALEALEGLELLWHRTRESGALPMQLVKARASSAKLKEVRQ